MTHNGYIESVENLKTALALNNATIARLQKTNENIETRLKAIEVKALIDKQKSMRPQSQHLAGLQATCV